MRHFYRIEQNDPAFNLALEQTILARTDAPAFSLWRNAPSVIIGRNQNAQAEVDLPLLAERGIRLVRRETGGGAVYHDLGNVNFSFFSFLKEGERFPAFEDFLFPMIEILRSFGVEAEFSGRNDISVAGRKVSGCAKCVHDGRVLFHGTLLFDCDLDAMEAVLSPPECKLQARGVRSVRSRVMNLKERLPDWDADRFFDETMRAVLKRFGAEKAESPPEEWMREAEALAEAKHRKWEWNVGSSPEFSHSRTMRFPCGTVSLSLSLRKGVVRSVRIHGDFFGTRDVRELEDALCGVPFRKEELERRIALFPVSECVEGLSGGELLALFAPES